MTHSLSDSDIMSKVKEEFCIYNNLSAIAEKLDNDGYLRAFAGSIESVFTNEISFALNGRLTRSAKNEERS